MKKKQTGIWLDFKDCYIVSMTPEVPVQHLSSDVRHPATKGGTRSKSPWGPQFSPSDRKDLEREKHADHAYFQQILESIDTDELVIFGPAQAKLGLKKEVEAWANSGMQLLGVLPADYLTQNEIVALVRDFYKAPGEFLDRET